MMNQHDAIDASQDKQSDRRLALVTLALALALILSAMTSCSSNSLSGSGSVRVMLTDAPLDLASVSAVNVTIAEVSLKTADDEEGESERLILTGGVGMVVNLLDYQNGETMMLAMGEVPEGEYSKIRFHVTNAELVRDDDGDPMSPEIVETIFNPSGKVDIPVTFIVTAGDDEEITLDFDAALSVQVNQTGGVHPYILRPVINVLESN